MSVINSPLFHTLPTYVVNTILLFTGKFVVDKRDKTKLRSIIIIGDYENINTCVFVKRRKMWHIIHPYRLNFNSSSKEDREKEELQHAACVDYYRHPLLFLKPSKLEDVMHPLQSTIICMNCEQKCSSSELALYTVFKLLQLSRTRYIPEYNCARCNGIIKQQYNLINQDVYKYKHHHRKIESHKQIVKQRKLFMKKRRYHSL